jgi:hypothetical protein
VNKFTVDANFESPTIGWDQFHGFDFRYVANFRRQTGGSRFVVSSRAVFDCDVSFHVVVSRN